MEVLIILFGILAAFAVPLGVIATVQYCVLAGVELNFRKLLLFSWTLVIAFMPFSFFYGTTLITDLFYEAGRNSADFYMITSLVYLVFGWFVCSALYGKLILPNFSGERIDLP